MRKRNRIVEFIKAAIILAVLFIAGNILNTSIAAAGEEDFVIKNGVLEKYQGDEEGVQIPSKVTEIGPDAFMGNIELVEVIIPDSVRRIGFGAFSGCKNLEEIVIPDSVEYMENNIFAGCTGLKKAKLSAKCMYVGDSMFMDCTSLKSIDIPDGVINIGWYAFMGCTNLENITIPDTVINFGTWSFKDTKWLKNYEDDFVIINNILIHYKGNATEVVIPDNVISIEESAFDNCAFMLKVTIPNGVTYIGSGAFSGCAGLTEITIPGSVRTIGEFAFYDCTNLETINIPENITDIYYNCVKGTKFYKEYEGDFLEINGTLLEYLGDDPVVVIPEGIKRIGTYAFYANDTIEELIIPGSVKQLDVWIAANCSKLAGIKISNGVENISTTLFYNCSEDMMIYGVKGTMAEQAAVEMEVPFSGISLNSSNITLYAGGTTSSATLSITGNTEPVIWVTLDEDVAAVSEAGVVTAVGKGTTELVADINGVEVISRITVKEVTISFKKLELKVSKTYTLSLRGITSGKITWKSSKTSVAVVDAKGKVTAKKAGTAIITATINGKQYKCTVIVKK